MHQLFLSWQLIAAQEEGQMERRGDVGPTHSFVVSGDLTVVSNGT